MVRGLDRKSPPSGRWRLDAGRPSASPTPHGGNEKEAAATGPTSVGGAPHGAPGHRLRRGALPRRRDGHGRRSTVVVHRGSRYRARRLRPRGGHVQAVAQESKPGAARCFPLQASADGMVFRKTRRRQRNDVQHMPTDLERLRPRPPAVYGRKPPAVPQLPGVSGSRLGCRLLD